MCRGGWCWLSFKLTHCGCDLVQVVTSDSSQCGVGRTPSLFNCKLSLLNLYYTIPSEMETKEYTDKIP